MEKKYLFAKEEVQRDLWKWTPQFSLVERDRRWAAVREKMALRDLDCLIISQSGYMSKDTWYMTHCGNTENALALFPLEGEPVVYWGMRPYDKYLNYGIGQNWVKDCRRHVRAEIVIDAVKTLKDWGFEKGNLGYTGQTGTRYRGRGATARAGEPGFARAVHARLPDVGWIDASYMIEELRMIKSPEEIKFHEKAAKIQVNQFEVLKETAATPSATEADLHANMIQAAIHMGADSSPMAGGMIDAGPFPFLHGRMIGGYPGGVSMRPLERGDVIILEWGTSYGGCNSYAEHSLSLGEPRKEFKEIFRVAKEAVTKGVDALRPGGSYAEATQVLRAPVKEAGMRYLELGFAADPPLCVYPTPEEEFLEGPPEDHFKHKGYYLVAPFIIKPNMCFRVLCDIFNPKWKESALMLGCFVHVTEDGPRILNAEIPMEFTIV